MGDRIHDIDLESLDGKTVSEVCDVNDINDTGI